MDPNILNSGAVRQLKTTKKLLTTKLPLSSGYMLLNFSNNHRLYSDAQPPESLSQHVWQPPNIEVHLDLKPSKCPRHPVGQAGSPATYNLPQPASVSNAWEGRGGCRALQRKPT